MAVGEQTALSGIMRLVAAAQASGSHTQDLADRAAAILFYVAVASGATTSAYWWWLSGDKEHALIRTATVLIIACPHALGLAIPLVIAISTSIGPRMVFLLRTGLRWSVPAIWTW
jgi:Cu2+-exporting ATPase